MEPDPLYVIQQLRSIVIHSLDTFNFKNAEFACERLLAAAPEDPDSVYLYALTLYRQGKYKAVYNRTLEEGDIEHLGCAYIFARLCLHLQRYKEGVFRLVSVAHLYNENRLREHESEHENGLFDDKLGQQPPFFFLLPMQRHNYEVSRLIYPDASAIYHLLGDLCKAQGDLKNSALNYQEALRFNAFDFEAFQELLRMGVKVAVKSLYKAPTQRFSVNGPLLLSLGNQEDPFSKPDIPAVPNPFATTPRQHTLADVSTPRAPDPLSRRPTGEIEPLRPAIGPRTRSRLFSYTKKPDLAHPDNRGLKRAIQSERPYVEPVVGVSKEVDSADAFLRRLYMLFAKLFKCFSKYDCYKAIRILESLPENERDTPWVLSKLGRLHYEIVNYKQSEKFFIRLRQLDRTRLEDMEFYSTLLWHLHKKTELVYLANELHDIDSKLAITWCVMGNMFSLNREPDEAIKCFNKSIALDSSFTYAHTLKGHEYFGADNYERALDCFRYSLLLDPRHYNAFYGIGMVYINLGEYHKADYHFRNAVAINPINIILICCVGMVLEKLGKKTLALRQYELANRLQPLSALPIFKKAQLLFSMQQFPQALKQFELVKNLAPNEASVHFLLGQLYNIQNDRFLAIREFTIALNLDPKGNYLIREAMEMLKKE